MAEKLWSIRNLGNESADFLPEHWKQGSDKGVQGTQKVPLQIRAGCIGPFVKDWLHVCRDKASIGANQIRDVRKEIFRL